MAAYDFKLQNVASIAPTIQSGGSDLARFVNNMESARANRAKEKETNRSNTALEEHRGNLLGLQTRQQEWTEGADARAEEKTLRTNQHLLGYSDAMGELLSNYTPDAEIMAELEGSDFYKAMTPEQQAQYKNERLALASQDARMASDPVEYEKNLREYLGSKGLIGGEMLEKEVARIMQTEFKLQDKDVLSMRLQAALAGNPTTAALAKTYGDILTGGSSGSRKPGEFGYNDAIKNRESLYAELDRWETEKGDGRGWGWLRNITDVGQRDLRENEVIDMVNQLGTMGLNQQAALEAINSIREDDTTKFDLRKLANADINGDGEYDKVLRNMKAVGDNYMRQMGMTPGSTGQGAAPANLDGLLSILQSSQYQDNAQIQQILSGYKPRSMTKAERRQFWLGDYANPKPAPAPAPASGNSNSSSNTGTGNNPVVKTSDGKDVASTTDSNAAIDTLIGNDISAKKQEADSEVNKQSGILSDIQAQHDALLSKQADGSISYPEQLQMERLEKDIKEQNKNLFAANKQSRLLPQNAAQEQVYPEVMRIQEQLKNPNLSVADKHDLIKERDMLMELLKMNQAGLLGGVQPRTGFME